MTSIVVKRFLKRISDSQSFLVVNIIKNHNMFNLFFSHHLNHGITC